jgi:hypothetical protein
MSLAQKLVWHIWYQKSWLFWGILGQRLLLLTGGEIRKMLASGLLAALCRRSQVLVKLFKLLYSTSPKAKSTSGLLNWRDQKNHFDLRWGFYHLRSCILLTALNYFFKDLFYSIQITNKEYEVNFLNSFSDKKFCYSCPLSLHLEERVKVYGTDSC